MNSWTVSRYSRMVLTLFLTIFFWPCPASPAESEEKKTTVRKVRRHSKKKLSGQGDISYLTEEVLRIFEGLVDFINTYHCREIVCELLTWLEWLLSVSYFVIGNIRYKLHSVEQNLVNQTLKLRHRCNSPEWNVWKCASWGGSCVNTFQHEEDIVGVSNQETVHF